MTSMSSVVVRAWRGYASPSAVHAYPEHFRRNVLPELNGLAGFLGAPLLWADEPDRVEFLVLTRWASLDAIRAFAGDAIEQAVVEPEAALALVSFDKTVCHYEVIEGATNSGTAR